MSLKRRNTSSPEPDSPVSRKRRLSPFAYEDIDAPRPAGNDYAKVDVVYGQKSAFPGLGDEDGEMFYGPAGNGIDYLRMVRSEARSVPLVLAAPKTRLSEDDCVGEKVPEEEDEWEGGYFDDGAFIAILEPSQPLMPEPYIRGSGTQGQYHERLQIRFAELQAALRLVPPLDSIGALTSSQPISLPPKSKRALKKWKEIIRGKLPHPVQVACMDAASTLSVVSLLTRLLDESLRTHDKELKRRYGAWAWVILGRSKDLGELGSEEVSELREFGKQAVEVSRAMTHSSDFSHEVDNGYSVEIEESSKSDLEDLNLSEGTDWSSSADDPLKLMLKEAKKSLSRSAEETSAGIEGEGQSVPFSGQSMQADDLQSRMILDMIITVVGEVYGQKDLLEARDYW